MSETDISRNYPINCEAAIKRTDCRLVKDLAMGAATCENVMPHITDIDSAKQCQLFFEKLLQQADRLVKSHYAEYSIYKNKAHGIEKKPRPNYDQQRLLEFYKKQQNSSEKKYRQYERAYTEIQKTLILIKNRLQQLSGTPKPDEKSDRLKSSIVMLPENQVIAVCTGNASDNALSITGWYTQEGFQHRGFGTAVMKNMIERFLREFCSDRDTAVISYTWNGQNGYVLQWLESVGAVRTEDIAAQKYNQEDTWENHIYEIPLKKLTQKLKIDL